MKALNPLRNSASYGASAHRAARKLVALIAGAAHAHTTPLPSTPRPAYRARAAFNQAAGLGGPTFVARKRPLDAGAFFLPGTVRAFASATRGSLAGGAGEPFGARRPTARSANPASSVSVLGGTAADSNDQTVEIRMNRKQDRARTPEETLGIALDAALQAVAEQPAPANAEPLTRRIAFRSTGPGRDAPRLLAVNAGVPVDDAHSLAECLLCHVRARCSDAVGAGEPIQGDEAYAFELLIDLALSLYAACGENA